MTPPTRWVEITVYLFNPANVVQTHDKLLCILNLKYDYPLQHIVDNIAKAKKSDTIQLVNCFGQPIPLTYKIRTDLTIWC
jgi:hypothetical protein